MWEEQERRRWTEEQERRNRRRVEVQKRVDVQRDVQQQTLRDRRPSEPVARRHLEVDRLPPLEEVSRVPRPITARSIGDSLERADHHVVDHHHHPGADISESLGPVFYPQVLLDLLQTRGALRLQSPQEQLRTMQSVTNSCLLVLI